MKLICDRYKGDATVYYYDDYMALDIETSHTDELSWVSSIQVYFLTEYHLFRKPIDFINYLQEIIIKYELFNNKRLIVIIHNASYDLSYLVGYFQKYLPYKDDRQVLKRDKNSYIAYRQGGLDFRDTYALSNKSLEKWGKDLNVEHQKKVGLYDYTKLIYQDDILSSDEQEYDKYDVLSLYECFKKQLETHNDTTATVPYTSTGYVRRDCSRFCQKDKYYRRKYFIENKLNYDQFEMCINAFAGGYTHNNRFHNNEIVKGLIGHRDFRSMYPSELQCYPLPFGKPEIKYDISNELKRNHLYDVQKILSLYPQYSSITEIELTSAILKDNKISMPFLQKSKLRITELNKIQHDNGRILHFTGKATMCIDNHTLKILVDQYKLKLRVLKVLVFKNEYLPQCLRDLINKYFEDKSNYKIIAEKNEKLYGKFDEKTIESNINLMISKGKLNGIYGMFVQNPLSNDYDVDYEEDEFNYELLVEKLTVQEKQNRLDSFYNNRKKFLPYQVGVFVTALARYELFEFIKTIGYENCLYCDTDSIFYKKSEEIEEKIDKLNKIKRENAENLGSYIIDKNGKKIHYDYFSQEADIKEFKGLHSKCYGYVYYNEKKGKDEFCCTIAGIPSKTLVGMNEDKPIYVTREEELGNLTKLEDGFKFKINTGKTCNYSNYMLKEEINVNINGHIINTFGGAVISKLDEKEIKNMDLGGFTIRKGDI